MLTTLCKSFKVFDQAFGQVHRVISMQIACDMTQFCKRYLTVKRMPSQSTYSRFFNKFSLAKNTQVFPQLSSMLMGMVNIQAITLDLDSTVIARFGNQQGSAKGYTPLKRGRNSPHPLIAFISQTRTVAKAWLRLGHAADSSSCQDFLLETLSHALVKQKVGLLRADGGFYPQDILALLEEKKINYVVATNFFPILKKGGIWIG